MKPNKYLSKIPSPFVSIFMITSLFAISFFSIFVILQFNHHGSTFKHLKSIALDSRKTIKMIMINHVENGNDDDNDNDNDNNYDVLPPPSNATTAFERIAWFKQNLPKFKILESTQRSRLFDHRVNDFFNVRDCTIRFFIIWVSPSNKFGKRELLSLESIFKAHPKGCVVILSRTMDSNHGLRILRPLLARGFNILPLIPDFNVAFNNTPAQAWLEGLKAGKIDPGSISLAQNLSNLLRLAIVFKYGGIYLDADFLILRDMSLLRNSIGAQSIDDETKRWTRLNNAILIFDKGHPLLLKFMEEFASNFNGNRWGYNGPYLVSRVVQRVSQDLGCEFTILPPKAFYPVDWIKIKGLFKRPNSKSYANWAGNKLAQISRETYGVHLWNKESSKIRVEEGSIMSKLISKYCIICHDIYDS